MLYFFRVLIILLKGIIPRFASVVSMLWFVSAVSFRSFRPFRSFRFGSFGRFVSVISVVSESTVVPDEDFNPNRMNTDRIKAVRSIISPLNTTYMLTSEQQFTFLHATTPAENMFLTQIFFKSGLVNRTTYLPSLLIRETFERFLKKREAIFRSAFKHGSETSLRGRLVSNLVPREEKERGPENEVDY